MTVLLDPTSEQSPMSRERLARPERLEGLTVGLLDISKPRGNVFLDRLDERLTERGITVKRYMKPTVAKPAPLPLRQQMVGEVNVVIEGLADHRYAILFKGHHSLLDGIGGMAYLYSALSTSAADATDLQRGIPHFDCGWKSPAIGDGARSSCSGRSLLLGRAASTRRPLGRIMRHGERHRHAKKHAN